MNHQWWRGPRGEWYVVIQFLLFALLVLGPEATDTLPLWRGTSLLVGRILGICCGLFGLFLLGSGTINLGHNLTALPRPKDDSELVTTGVYSLVRHPIYSGILFGGLGWSLLNGSTLMLIYVAILFLFFDIKSRREEQWLSAKFAAYANYQQRVRKLIPFVY